MNDEHMEMLTKAVQAYTDAVVTGLEERLSALPIQLYESDIWEAISALLARQATLTIELAGAPSIWNPHIAPVILRAQTDAHMTLAWILRDPPKRGRQYILYGLGQEKLSLEHYRNLVDEDDDGNDNEALKAIIAAKEGWLSSQRHEFLTEVNVGSWSGISTKAMAEEADCEGLYRFPYSEFSAAVHSMWHHVSRYNLWPCTNPLHLGHKVGSTIDGLWHPDWMYRSAKYADRSFDVIDQTYELHIGGPMPTDALLTAFEPFAGMKDRRTAEDLN